VKFPSKNLLAEFLASADETAPTWSEVRSLVKFEKFGFSLAGRISNGNDPQSNASEKLGLVPAIDAKVAHSANLSESEAFLTASKTACREKNCSRNRESGLAVCRKHRLSIQRRIMAGD